MAQGHEVRQREEEAGARESVRSIRVTLLVVLISAVVLSLGGLVGYGPRAGLGVGIGGGIAVANLYVLWKIGQAFLGQRGRAAPWALIAVVKMTLLFGGVWLLLKSGVTSALALAVGYGSLPIGITLGSLFMPKPGGDEPSVPLGAEQADGGRSPGDTCDEDVVKARRRDAGAISEDDEKER